MRMRDEKTSQTLVGKPEGKDHLENLGMDGQLVFIWTLTLNLLTTTIVAPPNNASKWQMGFNSAFKGLKKSKEGA